MKKVFTVVLLLSVLSVLPATPLWGGAEYGMTVEKVRELFPGIGIEPHYTQHYLNYTLTSYSQFLPENPVARYANFHFENDKLVSVVLELKFGNDNLVRLTLIAKYGPFIDRAVEEGIFGNQMIETLTWLNGQTIIQLTDSSEIVYLNVEYLPTDYL